MKTEKVLLTVKEAAELLSVTEGTVRDMAARGELPALRVGRLWRFPRVALERWIEEQMIQQDHTSSPE